MSLKIEAFHTDDAFSILQAEWESLIGCSQQCRVFLTPQWQQNWWAAYHPGDLWILAVRNDNGKLVGLAPWFIDNDHPKGRLVRSVGCVDVTDYLEILLHRDYEHEVLTALAEYAYQHRDRFDAIDLCNIPESSHVVTRWPGILKSRGYTVTVKQQDVCPVIDLPDTMEGYFQLLNKKNRHEVRRKLRRISGAGVKVNWFYITPDDDLNDALSRFMKLMAASSPDKAEFLQDEKNVDFFRRVIPVMAEQSWLSLSFLQLDDQDAAAYISFDFGGHILLYNSGHDPAVYPDLSPGIVLLAYIIQDAIERGHEKFDFLRGDEAYKYRMGGQDTKVMTIHAVPTAQQTQ